MNWYRSVATAKSSKPTREQCELVRKLILKYPFLKDDMENCSTWSWILYQPRCLTVRFVLFVGHMTTSLLYWVLWSHDCQPAGWTLLSCDCQCDSWTMWSCDHQTDELDFVTVSDVLDNVVMWPSVWYVCLCVYITVTRRESSWYPVNSGGSACEAEDADSLEKHKKAIATDLGKAKPRDSVLLPLMKSTYREQQMFEVTSVAVILTNHPVLSRPAIVSSFPNFSQNSTLSEK